MSKPITVFLKAPVSALLSLALSVSSVGSNTTLLAAAPQTAEDHAAVHQPLGPGRPGRFTSPMTQAEMLTVAPGTIEISAAGIQPQQMQVTVGQVVAISNTDSRARTIVLLGDQRYRVYMPIIMKGAFRSFAASPSFVAGPDGPAPGTTLTIQPGQTVNQVFDSIGNFTVAFADGGTAQSVVFVVAAPFAKAGRVIGQVRRWDTKQPLATAQVGLQDGSVTAVSVDAQGRYSLPLDPGEYTIAVFATGFTFAHRRIIVQANSPTALDTIDLKPRDIAMSTVNPGGGSATNTQGNTDVVFAPGAVDSAKAVVLTDLPVDPKAQDFSSLPGPFNNGVVPLGFVSFEPDGTKFSAPVTWTIAYTGPAPLGYELFCYYWLEKEARWGEPVPAKVVDMGNGKKGLRAILPHFSIYGHGATPNPPPPPPKGDQGGPTSGGDGSGGNKNEGDNDCPKGSLINLMSGRLCQTVSTLSLPNIGQLPARVYAKYRSNMVAQPEPIAHTLFAPGNPQPDRRSWRFEIAGKTFTGTNEAVNIAWDHRDAQGNTLPPGKHIGKLSVRWEYYLAWLNAWSIGETPITWTIPIQPPADLSPFGLGWLGPHDTVLIDRGSSVSIVQGEDGRMVAFEKNGNGYTPQTGEFSALAKNADGSWTRTERDGSSLGFNADGRLTKIADRYGNFQLILYESNGRTPLAGQWAATTRIRRIADNSGNTFDYTYDGKGWLGNITDSAGRIYRYEHNAQGHLTAFVDPAGQRETFSYDGNGLMTSHTDARQFKTSYNLDARGRVVTRTWPTGTTLQMSYVPTRTTMTDDRGVALVLGMDAQFNPTQRFNGVYTVTTTYDAQLNPTGTDSPPRTTLYDANGHVLTSVDGSLATQMERNGPFDQVTRSVGNDGTDSRYAYDAQGNLTSVTNALGQTTRMTYDTRGQLLTIADPLNNITSFEHNPRGQMTRMTDPLGRITDMTYDVFGDLATVRDPLGRVTTMSYDMLGRMTAIRDALNGLTGLAYNAGNKLTQITDQTSRSIQYSYDALNRLTQILYADGGKEQFGYDPNGNLTQFTDARGTATTYAYDAAGRRTEKAVAGGATVSYGYDALDQMTKLVDSSGVSFDTVYQRGKVGAPRLIEQTAVGVPLNVTTRYDYGDTAPLTVSVNLKQFEFYPDTLEMASAGSPASSVTSLQSDKQESQVRLDVTGQSSITDVVVRSELVTPSITSGLLVTEQKLSMSRLGIDSGIADKRQDQPDVATSVYAETRLPNAPTSIIHVAGALTADTVWTNGNVYVMDNDVDVPVGITLTLEPGAIVKGWGNCCDRFDIEVYGKLVANGTPAQPIVFTSLRDDSYGGDTNGDATTSAPAPNDWGGIYFHSGSQSSGLTYVVARYSNDGIYYDSVGPNADLSFINNKFQNNNVFAIYLNLVNTSGSLRLSGNEASGNLVNGVSLRGAINGAFSIDASLQSNFAIMLNNDLDVTVAGKLTLSPGTVIKGWGNCCDRFDIEVFGELVANGTAAQPIIFTSLRDDSYGGDTNGDGSASAAAGNDWGGIYFHSGDRTLALRHAVLAFSGDGAYFDNVGSQMNLALTNNKFFTNTNQAVFLNLSNAAGQLTVADNVAVGNLRNGIAMQGTISGNLSVEMGQQSGFPLILTNDLDIKEPGQLTLSPGTLIKAFGNCCDRFDVEVYGKLIANGTSEKPIIFTSLRDDSVGGDSNNDSTASSPAGNDWGGIYFHSGKTTELKYVTIAYSTDSLHFDPVGANTTLNFENNRFINNTNSALFANLIDTSGTIRIAGNQASGNGINGFSVQGTINGALSVDTGAQQGFPLHLSNDLNVKQGAQLTLSPNTIVKGWGNCCDRFDLEVYGQLISVGTAAQPIVFTSLRDDAYGGDTNNDGTASQPAVNDWGGIYYHVGNQNTGMTHTVVAYSQDGASYSPVGEGTQLFFTNNTFKSNAKAITIDLDNASGTVQLANNQVFGNATNGVRIHGTITGVLTLDNNRSQASPFVLTDDLTVNKSGSLNLLPGTVIKGWGNCCDRFDLNIKGKLMAHGTPVLPVIFTSLLDDGVGGDTSNDGASVPSVNNWGGIYFDPGAQGDLSNVMIAYSTDGIYAADADVRVTNSSFIAQGNFGAFNTTPSRPITATANYWGATTGPTHASNPGGNGQRVSDGVIFKPFLNVKPLPGGGRLRAVWQKSNDNPTQELRFTYNAIGELTSLKSIGPSTFELAYTYDAANRLTARTAVQGSPLSNAYGYDAASQLTQLTINGPGGALHSEGYGYNAAGNVISVNSSRDGAIAYGYDALDRLTSVTSPGFNATYAYDAAGNRTSAGGVNYTYDAGGRLVSASDGTAYTYDAAGNLKTKAKAGQTTTYTWDGQGRLARIDYANGTYSAYQYDDYGRRISKRMPDGATSYFVYLGKNLAQELNATGGVIASYTFDGLDRPISMWRDGNNYFYILDRLGTVIGLSNGSGEVLTTYSYDPGGNLIHSTGTVLNPFRFTSREFDGESGLYFYRARYYDAQTGRFLSRDPIGVSDGTNLYSYVRSNPTNSTDPSGLYGTSSCEYYSTMCRLTGSIYYCHIAAGVCKYFPDFDWGKCVRQCLQDFDKDLCQKGGPCPKNPEFDFECTFAEAHAYCFYKCYQDSKSNPL